VYFLRNKYESSLRFFPSVEISRRVKAVDLFRFFHLDLHLGGIAERISFYFQPPGQWVEPAGLPVPEHGGSAVWFVRLTDGPACQRREDCRYKTVSFLSGNRAK